MDDAEKLARDWQVTEDWIRETIKGTVLDAEDLRMLGKDTAEIISGDPVEREERSIWDDPGEPHEGNQDF